MTTPQQVNHELRQINEEDNIDEDQQQKKPLITNKNETEQKSKKHIVSKKQISRANDANDIKKGKQSKSMYPSISNATSMNNNENEMDQIDAEQDLE